MKKFLAGFLMGNCAPLDLALKPLLLFGFRFYVAYVFFKSGLTKVDDSFQVTSSTLDLFKYEYMSYASESIATIGAYMASYAELILSILLVIGIFTRPAALGLFILNAVAAYSLAQTDFASAAGHWQHIVWGIILAVLFIFGPGKFSFDKWISDKLYGREANLIFSVVSVGALSAIGYFLATKFL